MVLSTTRYRGRSRSLWFYKNLLWQLSMDEESTAWPCQQLGAEQDLDPCGTTKNLLWQLSIDENSHGSCHDSLDKTIIQGILQSGRYHSWQRKCWIDDAKEWMFLPMLEQFMTTSRRKDWTRISDEPSFMSPRQPSQSRDRPLELCMH